MDTQKLKLLLDSSALKIADSMRVPMQYQWNNGGTPNAPCPPTEQERYDAVLKIGHDMIDLLMPGHEDKAREIYALIPWPVRAKVAASEDFGPVPTFEKFVGRQCDTCGGSGVTGFLSGIRCPDC